MCIFCLSVGTLAERASDGFSVTPSLARPVNMLAEFGLVVAHSIPGSPLRAGWWCRPPDGSRRIF